MTCISDSENYLIRLVPFSWITRNGGSSRSTTSCHKAVLAKQKGTAKSSFKVRWDFADLKTSSLALLRLLYDGSDVNLTPRKCSHEATGILPDLLIEGNVNDVARCAYIDLLHCASKEVVKLQPIVSQGAATSWMNKLVGAEICISNREIFPQKRQG
jgi:hypothetical protein